MAPMTERALREIGSDLDRQTFPRVKDRGIVTPSDTAVTITLGEEKHDVSQRRSTTGSWKGTTRGERPAGRSWSPRRTTPFVGASLEARYEEELDEIERAYPGTKVWKQKEGLWLLSKSSLLEGLQRAAIFLVGISYAHAMAHGWGFWKQDMIGVRWIGPRHTNFPDGSICAFYQDDETWIVGDSIIKLLDLYSVWALRHLYLEEFGRWPGPQAVFHPYERLLELRDDEYCGCGQSGQQYGMCCRDRDLARNRIADAVNFTLNFAGGLREPPAAVVRTVYDQSKPPRLDELYLN
ncbi:MAG: hypothetical protein HY322_03865 [Betaproteobacteria bacterium]|nr:hypothetical protein [Betaproteobacteria bacterium]